MSVITISRGSYSGGKMLAEALAQKLGYRCIDRDLIVQKAAASGISGEELKTALDKPPTFLGHSRHAAYVYLAVIQAALTEEVRSGNAIYHGLAGHLLLKDATHVLRTRVVAPMEFRIAKVQQRLELSRKQAIAYIQKIDEERRKWTHSLYGVDWADPALYDIVINLDRLKIEQACEVICSMLKQEPFRWTRENQQAMEDLAIASRIRANLATNFTTSELELEIKVHSGVVMVKGALMQVEQADHIRQIAGAVPGVKSVNLDKMALVARL
ncbi:MAG: cytidylate kinase family protein [Terriglobales bacterium]